MREIIQSLLDNPMALLNVVVSLGILIHCVCVINKMASQTPFIYSFAYILLAVGSFAVVIGILYGKLSNEPQEICMNVGVLIICLFDTHYPFKKELSDNQ
jgi:hypothetical protein